jgi:hypothetical protein
MTVYCLSESGCQQLQYSVAFLIRRHVQLLWAFAWSSFCADHGKHSLNCLSQGTLPSQWFPVPASLRVSTTATDSANSGCFVERGRCDRRCTRHAKIPSGSSLTSDTWINCRINEISIKFNWNNKIIEIQIITSIVRVSEHFSKMLVLSGVFNTRILDATNYANQDYMLVNYTLIVVYTMLLVTGSQSKNFSCFCLDMAQS